MKIRKLPRKTVWVDKKGRFTIPAYLREAAGIESESWVLMTAEPDLENCKGLLLMRERN